PGTLTRGAGARPSVPAISSVTAGGAPNFDPARLQTSELAWGARDGRTSPPSAVTDLLPPRRWPKRLILTLAAAAVAVPVAVALLWGRGPPPPPALAQPPAASGVPSIPQQPPGPQPTVD